MDPNLTLFGILPSLEYFPARLRFKVQRATALVLAMGESKPYSQKSRTAMAKHLQGTTPTSAQVQTALRRLNKLGFADTYTGNWALDDPEFAHWIRDAQIKLPKCAEET